MSARHGVNQVTVGMRPEHLLHAIAGAKRQIARGIKLTIALAQNPLRRLMTVMTFHNRKPIQKKSCQRQSVPFRRFSSDLTQSAFCKSKNYVRFEMLHRFFQSSIACQRPDKILVVRDPRSQSRTESTLSQSMNQIRQS